MRLFAEAIVMPAVQDGCRETRADSIALPLGSP